MVKKVWNSKCPVCDKGEVFEDTGNILLFRSPKMHSHCSECNHKYETEPGFFFGAMFVSYALIVAEMMGTYFLIQFFNPSTEWIIAILFAVIGLMSFTNFRWSRLIWMYMLTPKKKVVKEKI